MQAVLYLSDLRYSYSQPSLLVLLSIRHIRPDDVYDEQNIVRFATDALPPWGRFRISAYLLRSRLLVRTS
ncbi:hypothetical protein SCP_1302480 [Sparassis crispa]|uniref:Uncharacterized protein n=1 Tax=Sparassis crispa TaxID=139825 RepID=A0A401H214_9APHY|nr:hypothetical protein SCP_1302480 [Sparassis crispa]GBE88433.1 hypothetical protein SCP_1302480 [Sparassis crispa]